MTNKLSIAIIGTVLSVLLSACANVQPFRSKIYPTEHIVTKNYVVGKRQSVYIGEAIVRVKDYKKKKRVLNKIEALNDFKVTMPLYSHTGYKGDKYQIVGISKKGNKFVYMIQFPTNYGLKWGINKNGYFADFLLGPRNNIRSPLFVTFEPKNTRFQLVKEKEIDAFGGFINFEIIYNGITDESINLLFREYTPDNMAKATFYQNLTYEIDTKTIRFKKIKIEFHKISNKSIEYTVVEDRLKK